jgi:hypothetical protein
VSHDLIFQIVNWGVIPFWLLLVVLPHWGLTQILVHSIAIPLLLGVAYAWYLTTGAFGVEGASFSSLEGVMVFFSAPGAVLAGWIHYLVFDLFIGAWQVRDAKRRGINHWFVIPCLFFTLMAGPIGLLLYLVVRLALSKGGWSLIEQDA